MLTEETVVDRIEIDERGIIGVRRASFIVRDGVRLPTPSYHRTTYEPGAELGGEDPRVHAIAAIVWTDEIKAAAIARREQWLAAIAAGALPAL